MKFEGEALSTEQRRNCNVETKSQEKEPRALLQRPIPVRTTTHPATKEQNSTEINQFRPISLLNVERKTFFSVMASRLTKYLTENGYIDTSVQKRGITGISGCLKHATMIWEAIKRAKSEKLNLDVMWLDLANAYGSVTHQMIQLALRVHRVPEDIQMMLDKYFNGFRMRFSTSSDTTDRVNLEIGIAMCC